MTVASEVKFAGRCNLAFPEGFNMYLPSPTTTSIYTDTQNGTGSQTFHFTETLTELQVGGLLNDFIPLFLQLEIKNVASAGEKQKLNCTRD